MALLGADLLSRTGQLFPQICCFPLLSVNLLLNKTDALSNSTLHLCLQGRSAGALGRARWGLQRTSIAELALKQELHCAKSRTGISLLFGFFFLLVALLGLLDGLHVASQLAFNVLISKVGVLAFKFLAFSVLADLSEGRAHNSGFAVALNGVLPLQGLFGRGL